MNTLRGAITAGQAIVLGVVIAGCATAATITGHMMASDLVSILILVGGGAVGVAGAHIGGQTATNALTSAATPTVAPGPVPTGPAASTAPPVPSTGPAQNTSAQTIGAVPPAPPAPVVTP